MKATLSLVQIMEICELKDNLTNSARFGGKPFGMVNRLVWRSRKSLILYYNPEWGVESTGVGCRRTEFHSWFCHSYTVNSSEPTSLSGPQLPLGMDKQLGCLSSPAFTVSDVSKVYDSEVLISGSSGVRSRLKS